MFKKMLLLMTVVLLSVNGPVLAIDHWWHGGVSNDLNDPANWTDRDISTDPTTPGNDITRIGGAWGSEDLDGNGVLDPGEDLNGNGVIDDPVPPDIVGRGGYYSGLHDAAPGGGYDVPVDPVLSETYISRNGTSEGGWWFVLNAPNILTLEDGAFIIMNSENCNLRNGGRLEVQGRSSTDGPSLIVAKQFRIAEDRSVSEAAHETSQLRINGTGWVQTSGQSGVAFYIGTPDDPGTMPRGEIIIEDQGRLEVLSADPQPYLDFGNADPSVNQIIIRDQGELLLPGDPNAMGRVGADNTVTSLQEMIDMGLITSDTGITVSGSDPTVVTAAPSPFTIVDLPATDTDAAIGIDAAKTYTHALDFGSSPLATINGVAFDKGPTANLSAPYEGVSSQGYGYVVSDTRDELSIGYHGGNNVSAYADGASADMLKDMIYYGSADVNEGIILTLQDLIPGTEYSVRWYYRPWDPPLPRPITIIADGSESIDIDIDLCGGAQYLDYTFVADDNDVTMEFITNNDNQGVHLYGITCEVVLPTQDPATEGLLAYYAMDGDATDGSGNGNDGVIMGDPGFVDGAAGQAIDLDGDGDYIDCGANPLFGMQETNELTVATWVTIRSVAHQWAAIVAKGEYSWRVGIASRDPIFHFGIAWGLLSDTTFFDGVTAVGFDEWHHVAAVFDGANMMIYLDGVLDNSVPTTEKIGTKADETNVFIGENPAAAGRYWDGLIDEVLIYNRALTEDEIATIASLY